jgi:hypothetical protein
MSEKEYKIAWSEEEEKEYLEYTGVVVRAEFNTPWANSEKFEGTVNLRLELQVLEPEGWENQYIWVPPSDKKGTKWSIFRDCLKKTGAWKDLNITGNTDEERMASLCRNIIGMVFHVEKHANYPGWGGRLLKQVNLITKYLGKQLVAPKAPVETEKIEEGVKVE